MDTLDTIRVATFLLWSLLLTTMSLFFSVFASDYSFLRYLFWGVTGLVAGLVIVDFQRIIIEAILSSLVALLIMFVILSLPAFLGTLSYSSLNELVYSQSLRIIFSSTFPFMLLINLIASIIGGYTGETWLSSDS
ncbi:hypothetical protein HXY33_03505 [Candidatus Bathyarchaeota archaeon]|nr:hypothetical protein [Candidatus Bathyarchaeota archaeon]